MTLERFDTILAFVLIITGVSLVVTTLTQAISAFLGLRGSNLRWGIETLLANIDPNLKDHAGQISRQVLAHELASDSTLSSFTSLAPQRWRWASAIRQDELVAILKLLAASPPTQPGGETVVASPWAAELKKSFEEIDPQAADDVIQVARALKTLFPDDAAKAQSYIGPVLDSAATLPTKIDKWFDSVMDRASQRFTVQMRIWTVAVSVIVAFALQLDAFQLFSRLSADSQVRFQVLSAADSLNKQAVVIGSISTDASPTNAIQADLSQLNSILTNNLILQVAPVPYPDPFYKEWSPGNRVFWGILASAALLGLGSPFWFNTLKNLANLQPVVARKEQAEAAAASNGD